MIPPVSWTPQRPNRGSDGSARARSLAAARSGDGVREGFDDDLSFLVGELEIGGLGEGGRRGFDLTRWMNRRGENGESDRVVVWLAQTDRKSVV